MNPFHRSPWFLAALASCSVACVTYRDRVVTVTTQTRIEVSERREQAQNANVNTIEVGSASGMSPLSLPMVPGRIDAPMIRQALDGYGEWVDSGAYGTVWIPYEEQRGEAFVPYLTAGQWAPTTDGWYWQSQYAWGAVPFHYGRWVMHGQFWAWVPGAAFAPAWVDWRMGNGWTGWAPLAPLGAAYTAPHMYCAWGTLQGVGLFGRVVQGPAAASLYAYTSPARTVYGYGGALYSPGPPVPEAVAVGAGRMWSTALATPPAMPRAGVPVNTARAGVPADGTGSDPVGRPPLVDGPTRVLDVPTVPHVLTAANGTLRALDSFPTVAPTHIDRLSIVSANTDGEPLRRPTVSLGFTAPDYARYGTATAPSHAASTEYGYGAVAPRRITWAPSVQGPVASGYGVSYAPSAPAAYERAVSSPPPAAPSGSMGWHPSAVYGSSPVNGFQYGGVVHVPQSYPSAPSAVVAGTYGSPVYGGGSAFGGGAQARPSYVAPSPTYAAPVMRQAAPSYVAPSSAATMAPYVPAARGFSAPSTFAPGAFGGGGGRFRTR